MKDSCFGEMTFNTGWKASTEIILFGKPISIKVKAKAYYEKDGITAEQEEAFLEFNTNKDLRLKVIEKLLYEYSPDDAADRFAARVLLFERDGSYAMLLDDKNDEDNGIAVCLMPKEQLLTQDDYL